MKRLILLAASSVLATGCAMRPPVEEGSFREPDLVELTSLDQLIANVTLTNPIKPPTEWPVAKVLPNSKPGNHFLIPLDWAGLGEVPEVIEQIRRFEIREVA